MYTAGDWSELATNCSIAGKFDALEFLERDVWKFGAGIGLSECAESALGEFLGVTAAVLDIGLLDRTLRLRGVDRPDEGEDRSVEKSMS